MKKIYCILAIVFFAINSHAQKIELLSTDSKASLRGLCVVNNQIIWASGSKGTVLKSIDAGKTWQKISVQGYEKTDFRDIEAFDKNIAIIMGIDTPAVILKTVDGGKTWKCHFKNNTPGMFLDAMEFWNEQSGIVIGDPIDGRFFIGRTFDGGNTWRTIPLKNIPRADSGEAFFASSGTNIRKINNAEIYMVSGGKKSNLFIRDRIINLPLAQGKESTGANSIAIKNKKEFMIVGGDFTDKSNTHGNCVYTIDGAASFKTPTAPPNGYRSCAAYLYKNTWICCGLTGVDISIDGGNNFSLVSNEGFHVVQKAKKGTAVFFAGSEGRIGKFIE